MDTLASVHGSQPSAALAILVASSSFQAGTLCILDDGRAGLLTHSLYVGAPAFSILSPGPVPPAASAIGPGLLPNLPPTPWGLALRPLRCYPAFPAVPGRGAAWEARQGIPERF